MLEKTRDTKVIFRVRETDQIRVGEFVKQDCRDTDQIRVREPVRSESERQNRSESDNSLGQNQRNRSDQS
jgi:hypothetical protein